MTQLSSKSINDNDTSPSADDEVIESFNLAISPWRSSMQVNTKKTSPLGQPGGAVYAIALNQRCRRSYNNSAWISDFNMHGEKRICQLVPSFHLSLTMVHVTLCAQSAQKISTSISSLCIILEWFRSSSISCKQANFHTWLIISLQSCLYEREAHFGKKCCSIAWLEVCLDYR